MMLNLLKEFAEIYHLNKGLGELEYTSESLHVEKSNLSGQLKEFYQHLSFNEEAYFRGAPYDFALFPLSYCEAAAEGWKDQGWKETYVVFAHLMGDEVIFCDLENNLSPVYGRIPGDSKLYHLSPSLSTFLTTYMLMKKLEITQFENNIYIDEDLLDYKEGFLEEITAIINEHIPEDYREDFIAFILG